MTKREAKRLVCRGVAAFMSAGENSWLDYARDDLDPLRACDEPAIEPLSEADAERMHAAFEELHDELQRRGGE